MSILFSVATPYCATHVSDMQVTAIGDGKPLPVTQRKSIPYSCNQVRCLVGWTGLAVIEGHNTGNWLHGQLDVLSREDPPLQVFLESLTNSATFQFAMLPDRNKRCQFSLAGWFMVSANQYASFASEISNYEIYPWQLSASHSARFQYAVTTQKRPSKHPYALSISGDEATAKELPLYSRGLRGLLKHRVSVDVVSGACRQMAAAVAARQHTRNARDPRYVKTVGQSQLTVEMTPDGSVRTFSSTHGIITNSFPADIISPELATKNIEVDRAVDANGTVQLHLRGWVKVNAPRTIVNVGTH
jgi:hypothetical protein